MLSTAREPVGREAVRATARKPNGRVRWVDLTLYHATRVRVRINGSASDYALRDRLRRCSVSVMSNIAEGHERGGNREFRRFLRIAKGSCGELRSQLYTAEDVGYLEHSLAAQLRTTTLRFSRAIEALAQHRSRPAPTTND